MTHIYAFANQKGGVGKTTTVVNLSAALADWGFHVLLVDVDPQGNATTSLGVNPREVADSSYEVLLGMRPASEVIRGTRWSGLDLVPSTPGLAGATVELNALSDPKERAERLSGALSTVEDYDYILIDSPPSLGLLTINSLCAAYGVVIPVQCEYLALEGLTQLMYTISLIQRSLNARLQVRGLVMTMYDKRTTLSRQVVEEVQHHFPNQVFRILIPRSVRLGEAPSYGEPGVFYAPRSAGALAYRVLAWEILSDDGYEVDWAPPPEVLED